MKKVNVWLMAAAALMAFTAPAAMAAPYVGVSVGSATLSGDAVDYAEAYGYDVEDTNTGFKLFVGTEMTDNLAIEVFYADLGGFSGSDSWDLNMWDHVDESIDASAKTLGVALKLSATINDSASLYGKLGVHRYSLKGEENWTVTDSFYGETYSGSESGSDKGTGMMFGVGADVNLTPTVSVLFEAERYKLGDAGDVTLLSIGIAKQF